MQDPYSALGVPKTANQEEIKKAYRKFAKKYHPDVNAGNTEMEKKFKEVSHAFDLIGTEEARAKFDRGEEAQQFYQGEKSRGGGFQDFSSDFDAEDIFQSIFGAPGRGGARRHLAGEDEIYKLEVEFKDAALGGEKVITLPNGKKLQIKIPAGLTEGQKLRFKGQGSPGHRGGKAGDIYIEARIQPLDGFTRIGNDIQIEVSISFFEALLGGEIQVPTLDGQVMLRIPAGVSTGSKLRVKGKGAGAGEKRGNQIVVLKVVTPKDVPVGLRDAVSQLKNKYDYYPRSL